MDLARSAALAVPVATCSTTAVSSVSGQTYTANMATVQVLRKHFYFTAAMARHVTPVPEVIKSTDVHRMHGPGAEHALHTWQLMCMHVHCAHVCCQAAATQQP